MWYVETTFTICSERIAGLWTSRSPTVTPKSMWCCGQAASVSRRRGGGGSGGGGGYVATPLSVGSKTPRAFRATTAARIVPTATASLRAHPFMVG